MFVKICWVITALASAVGLFILFATLSSASGAPQEAAGAAIAVACVAIPHVFTRAMEGVTRK